MTFLVRRTRKLSVENNIKTVQKHPSLYSPRHSLYNCALHYAELCFGPDFFLPYKYFHLKNKYEKFQHSRHFNIKLHSKRNMRTR